MPLRQSIFTLLEEAVLQAIFRAYPADQAKLESQLGTAKFLSRENTGAGFYTRFTVDRDSSPPIEGDRLRTGPQAQIDGIKHGMGFILWLENGYADCLEGYTYDDQTTALNFEAVSFRITNQPEASH